MMMTQRMTTTKMLRRQMLLPLATSANRYILYVHAARNVAANAFDR
jgi:hypothetical protein